MKENLNKFEAKTLALTAEIDNKGKKLLELEAQNASLKAGANTASITVKYDAVIDGLKSENTQLLQIKSDLESNIQGLTLTCSELERDKRVLEGELATRNNEVKTMISETQKLKFQNDDLKMELEIVSDNNSKKFESLELELKDKLLMANEQ